VQVSRALFPVVTARASEDSLLKTAIGVGLAEGWLSRGQPVIMVSGMNHGVAGSTNTLRIINA
jgi:hypothetical protein